MFKSDITTGRKVVLLFCIRYSEACIKFQYLFYLTGAFKFRMHVCKSDYFLQGAKLSNMVIIIYSSSYFVNICFWK